MSNWDQKKNEMTFIFNEYYVGNLVLRRGHDDDDDDEKKNHILNYKIKLSEVNEGLESINTRIT